MIRISGIKLRPEDGNIKRAVALELKINESGIKNIIIRRRSLDARKKDDIHYIYSVDAEFKAGDGAVKKTRRRKNGVNYILLYTL